MVRVHRIKYTHSYFGDNCNKIITLANIIHKYQKCLLLMNLLKVTKMQHLHGKQPSKKEISLKTLASTTNVLYKLIKKYYCIFFFCVYTIRSISKDIKMCEI